MSRPRKIARKDDGSRYLARMDVDDTHTEATDLGAAGEEVNTENIDVDADENDVHFDGNLESFEDSPNVQRPYHADDLWSLEWFERLVLWDPASASAASQRDHVPKVQVLGRRGLCDICLDIFKDCAVDSWGDDDTAEYFPGHDFEDTRGLCLGDFARCQPLHASTVEVQAGAAVECLICRHVLEAAARHNRSTAYGLLGYGHDNMEVRVREAPYDYYYDPWVGSNYLYGRMVLLSTFSPSPDRAQFVVQLHQNSIESPMGSISSLRLARHWYQECVMNHDGRCKPPSHTQSYPTRLLRIEGTTIKLLETSEETLTGPYATLSHCWGLERFPVLDPSTFYSIKAGWARTEFLPTFQDCFETLQFLGIDLVWIDSYCILQGDSVESAQDWLRESTLMGELYANSILTISAAHASGPWDGCFNKSAPRGQLDSCLILWRATASATETGWLLSHTERSSLEKEHLFSRAWVLQERVLSMRLLHFGTCEMHWQCASIDDLSESGVFDDQIVTINPDMLHPRTTQTQEILRQEWEAIVRSYTTANLTHVRKDKMVAIAGLAGRYATARRSEYLWGFVWADLPGALCWQGDSRNVRPEIPRAPSWSWFALDGFVGSIYESRHRWLLPRLVCIDTVADNEDATKVTLLCIGRVLSLFEAIGALGNGRWESRIVSFKFHDVNFNCDVDGEEDRESPALRNWYLVPVDQDSPAGPWAGHYRMLIPSRSVNGTYSRVGHAQSYPSTPGQPEYLQRLDEAINAQPAVLILLA